jgi:hypothetical protein
MTNPTARTSVTSHSKQVSRLKLYGYGEDPRVPNEGDLLIVSETFLRESNNHQDIEFEILLRGNDMFAMKAKVDQAFATFEANKEYLRQPATRYVSRSQPQNPAALLDAMRSHG